MVMVEKVKCCARAVTVAYRMKPQVLHQRLSSNRSHVHQGFGTVLREGAHNHLDTNALCSAQKVGETFEVLPDRNGGPGGKRHVGQSPA